MQIEDVMACIYFLGSDGILSQNVFIYSITNREATHLENRR